MGALMSHPEEAINWFMNEFNEYVTDGKYVGWVTRFPNTLYKGQSVRWNLKTAKHRFALYMLASAWSRNGKWEGLVRMAVEMTEGANQDWLDPDYWRSNPKNLEQSFSEMLQAARANVAIENGRNATAREDCVDSFISIARRINEIEAALGLAGPNDRFDGKEAYQQMRQFKGTGVGTNAWKIKILLIFRELRCQGFGHFPGCLCCVPDQRVRNYYAANIGALPINDLEASARIYHDFGDLYDLPAFYWQDHA